jgi:hypothetical protein
VRHPYQQCASNADVVIIKDGNEFCVLQHRYMSRCFRQTYHKSSLTNIINARR